MDIVIYARYVLIILLMLQLLVAVYTAFVIWDVNKFLTFSLLLTVVYIAVSIVNIIHHDYNPLILFFQRDG